MAVRGGRAGLARVARRHPALAALFALLVLAAVAFAGRAAVMAAHWAITAPDRTSPLEGWMTPRYVVRLRGIPPETMQRILGLPDGMGRQETLERIAAARGEPLDRFLADLDAALADVVRDPP